EADEVRGHAATPEEPRPVAAIPEHPGGGAARGGGTRRGPMRLRLPGRSSLWGTSIRRVPPCDPARGRRADDGGDHPATLPGPQRSRGGSVLRAGQTADAIVPGRGP